MDVSIIVPFYKGNQYMARLFRVIRNNAVNAPQISIELVLVNDSPDCEVIFENAWTGGLFSVQVINNSRNVGIHGSRVNGIRAAKGEFIQLLDQDDLLTDNAIASQLEVIGVNDLVVANGYDESDVSPGPIYDSIAQQKMVMEEKYYYTIGNMIPSPGQCVLRKEVFPDVWMDNPIHCNGSDDLLLWLLLFKSPCKWAINPRQLYTHVNTGVNFSLDFCKMRKSSEEVINFLKKREMITAAQEEMFVRRLNMRELYEGKGMLDKIKAMLLYPDIAWVLMMKKFRKGK